MTTPDQMCTCGHGAASAHDIQASVPAFTACVVTGCGCRAFTQASARVGGELAGREQRRRTTANILARIDRSKHIQEDEATLLRTLVTAEQADADQAREQLAAARAGDAPWITAYREDLTAAEERARKAERVANMLADAERYRQAAVAAHQGLREALRSAFGQDNSVSDDGLIACVRDILGQRDRVGMTTRTHKRALLTILDMDPRCDWDDISDAVRGIAKARQAAEQRNADNWTRAERAEATLTAVRKAVAGRRAEVADYEAERPPSAWSDAVAVTCDRVDEAIAVAALGDPQPANEPERCGQYGGHGEYCDYPREPGSEQCAFHAAEARTHDAEPADPCAHGCRQAADDLTRLGQEIDAEPRGSITDHTYEAADGLCGADFLGHICGAARDDHDLTEPEQPAEPLLRGTAPLVLSLDIAPAEIAALLSKVRRAARAMRKAGLL